MDNKQRHETRVQDPKIRINNFDEVSLGFDDETMQKEALRCLHCPTSPCVKGCPVNIQIPDFIDCLKNKDKEGALNVISKSSLLPAICGRVCPQERQCENNCVRKKLGGAVSIGALERCVGDYGLEKGLKDIKKPIPNVS